MPPINLNVGARAIRAAAAATGGGANVGQAQGYVNINVTNAVQANRVLGQVAQQMTQNFNQVNRATNTTVGGFGRLQRSVQALRGEISGLGIAGTAFVGLGTAMAGRIQEAEVQMRALVGNIAGADAVLEELRQTGLKTGVPFSDMLTFAVQLLPTLQGNTKELGRWYDLVRRTATLNRSAAYGGVAGATFSIREAYLSAQAGGADFVSLADRFNISKVALREALADTGGDFLRALDQVLNKMGITSQMADEMAGTFNASFRVATDAILQLLAEGFTPLIEFITPLLQQTAAYASELRTTQPAALGLGAAIGSIAVVGAPTLIFLANIIKAVRDLKAAGAFATLAKILPGLGRAGLVGAGAAIGGAAGIGITRAVGTVTQDERLQTYNFQKFAEDLDRLLTQVAWTVNREIFNTIAEWGQAVAAFIDGIGNMVGAMGRFLIAVGNMIPGGMGKQLIQAGAQYLETGYGLSTVAAERSRVIEERRARQMAGLSNDLFPRSYASGTVDTEEQVNQERQKIIQDWAQNVLELERSTAENRAEITRTYARERAETIAEYEESLAREAEDFARQRLRAEQQLARDIAQVREEAIRREQQWATELARTIGELQDDYTRTQARRDEDYNESVAEAKEKSNERLLELEEQYQDDREDAMETHMERLLDAAARLDARAVVEEQRRFARERREAEERLQKQKDDEQESLEERLEDMAQEHEKQRRRALEDLQLRIQDEQEAHALRLEQAREADAIRLEEMQESFDLQRAQEDEDRRIRLERQAEDHAQQLAQMAAAHAEQLAALDRRYASEKLKLDERMQEELADIGEHNASWLRIQESRQEESLRMWDEWWKEIEKRISGSNPNADPDATQPFRGRPYQSGGPVYNTGPAWLHAGEYVLNPGTTQALQDMLRGPLTQSRLMSALTQRQYLSQQSQSLSLSISPGAIVIQEATRPGQTGEEVERALAQIFARLAA